MIRAILFVTILGFGMLTGVLALTMFCIGFAEKLFAEEIEAIKMGQVEVECPEECGHRQASK